MSKLTAPLFSLGAKGSIGKALTFSTWKGINTVKQKPDPANPNTSGQQTQRGYVSAANLFWKILTTLDKAAWDLAATLQAKPMSGWNRFTKACVANEIAQTTPAIGQNYALTPGDTEIDVSIDVKKLADRTVVDSLTGITAYYGTELRNLGSSQALTQSGGAGEPYDGTITGLTNGTLYYVEIRDDDDSVYMSGIESDTPAA